MCDAKTENDGSPQQNAIKDLSKPFWLLLIFSIFGFVVFAAAFTHLQNLSSIQASEKLFRTVVSERYERLSELVLEYGYWDEAVEKLVYARDENWIKDNLGEYLKNTLKVSTAHVFDDRDNLTISSIDGKIKNDNVIKFGGMLTVMLGDARGSPTNKEPVPVSGILVD